MYFQRGLAFLELGRNIEATVDFTKVIQFRPNDPLGYINRGIALSNLNQDSKAFEDFMKATEIQPEFAEAHFRIGLLAARSDLKLAVMAFTKASQLGHSRSQAILLNIRRDAITAIEAMMSSKSKAQMGQVINQYPIVGSNFFLDFAQSYLQNEAKPTERQALQQRIHWLTQIFQTK